MEATTIVVYNCDKSRDAVANKFSILNQPGTFQVPFYALNSHTILFNGGATKFIVAAELADKLGANIVVYTVKKELKDPPWLSSSIMDRVKNRVTIHFIDVDDNEPTDSSSSDSESDLGETPVKGKTKDLTSGQVDKLISWFEVSITGARDGDVLVGVSKGTKKTMIKIHGSAVRPRFKDVNAIRQYPEAWKRFINKLGAVSSLKGMSAKQRDEWITEHETATDAYIGEDEGDDEDTWIELIQPGDGLLVADNVNPSDLERLMEGNPDHPNGWWKQEDIIEIIPAKPGSKARRHTLFFNKSYWRIANDYKSATAFDGLVFDVFHGTTSPGAEAEPGKMLLIVDDVTSAVKKGKASKTLTTAGNTKTGTKWESSETSQVAFLVDEASMVLNWANIISLIVEVLGDIQYPITSLPELHSKLDLIKANFKEYSAGSFKSLLQKLIRFRAKQVELLPEINGKLTGLIDSQLVLLMTMGALAINPGSFVPDIQRYVTGLESLAKRLGVIVCEDSSTTNTNELQSLFSGALLAQRVRTWRPSRTLLKKWFSIGLDAWAQSNKYDFRIEDGLKLHPFIISPDAPALENVSALIDELRSFGGDIGMIRYIAAHYQEATKHWNGSVSNIQEANIIPVMPIWHGVDQHWAPGIAYFVPSRLAFEVHGESSEPASTPFLTLFSRLFKEITGFNPRRNESLYRPLGYKDKGHNTVQRKLTFDETDSFVVEMRKAQKLYLMAKQLEPKLRPTLSSGKYVVEYELDISWLAGLVGVIDVKGTPPVIVTLNANNPLLLIAVRRPARQMKQEGLSAEREEKAKAEARSMLRSGLPLNKAKAPDKFLDKAAVYLKTDAEGNDYYVIRNGDVEKTWEEARKIRIELPYHAPIEKTMDNAILFVGEGIETGAWDALDELFVETPDETIRRVLYYISTFKTAFEMNRISRDGGGVQQAVVVEDIAAYQFMLDLSLLFPAALRLEKYQPQKFMSPVGPLLWIIRDTLKAKLAAGHEQEGWEDLDMYDRNERTLWEHQTSSLEELIETHEKGIRGSFLYLSVGLGKTLIVMSFIKYLWEHRKLPNYIIYSLPASAIESVCEEILAFGLPINLMIPLKTKKKVKVPEGVNIVYSCEPETGVVNLIEHDYLRRCQDELSTVADQTLFVFDEVHKMLADTLRTSAALQLSRLSKEFIVLTGTPVIDNKIYRLVPWLEQIINVEVNEANFWCAATIMVSRKASTGIKTETSTVEAGFTEEEDVAYKKLVPIALGGNNTMARMEQIKAAVDLSYTASDREMVRQIKELIKDGRGVMVVAYNIDHQERLKDALGRSGVKDKDIFLLTGKNSIFLTDEAVRAGKYPAYKVVITTVRQNAGYTLTYLSAFVSGIYPSNQAVREQLRGRINRLGSKHPLIKYVYVHCGVLTYIMEHHDQANSLSTALSDLGVEVGAK